MEKTCHMIASDSLSAELTRSPPRTWLHWCVIAAWFCALAPITSLSAADHPSKKSASKAAVENSGEAPLIALGVGDAVSVQVYGRPELTTATYVSDDGTIPIPLAGSVPVVGLSPAKAGQRIAAAFRNGGFLVNPQVTVLMPQFRGQQVSVLGAVRVPGRFVVESKTTVLDVLAQAGGTTENGADKVVLLRPDRDGKITRTSVDLTGLSHENTPLPMLALHGGDSIFVPSAELFYINGEVHTPNAYRLEPGMTVLQAIARSGGVTPRGSSSRIEIKRRDSNGSYTTVDGKLDGAVQANDVIRIKERIF